MTAPIRIAIVGMGKIAHDQHIPALNGSSSFSVVATVSRAGNGLPDVPNFSNIDELIASKIELDAISLCTPPQVRRQLAFRAIAEGWHVFLEKPPCATLAEVIALRDAAAAQGVSLFASWHSRFADGVEPARAWLANRTVTQAKITWREDVQVWHPGQDWIFEPGGFGVFDPGINALSIITRILPKPIFVEKAEIEIPENRGAPIAAVVSFRDVAGTCVSMDLDFRQKGQQTWDIEVQTDAGTLTLSHGGSILSIDGTQSPKSDEAGDDLKGEYPGLYRRFAAIIRAGVSDVDVAPLRLVSDAFMCAKINQSDPFEWE